jgi:hypothetical protein
MQVATNRQKSMDYKVKRNIPDAVVLSQKLVNTSRGNKNIDAQQVVVHRNYLRAYKNKAAVSKIASVSNSTRVLAHLYLDQIRPVAVNAVACVAEICRTNGDGVRKGDVKRGSKLQGLILVQLLVLDSSLQ